MLGIAGDVSKSLDSPMRMMGMMGGFADSVSVDQDEGLTMIGGRRSPPLSPPSPHEAWQEEVQEQVQEQGQEQGHGQEESEEESRQRETELLHDLALSSSMLASWPSPQEGGLLPFVSVSGALYGCADFVSCLVEMNRGMFDRDLPKEARRKKLFGSDQIVS
mmetsp:Transcript_22842/g.50798  ORF Transcript_22842/g.50798 Transcript_22842/m.50798 type:complete len:162 (-) Transcript_22842:246-731(-)